MARYARQHFPGALVHVISRFVDREFRLAGDEERHAVLERLPSALARSDWTLHAYALMSSHIHLAMIAGEAAAATIFKPLHVGVANYLNRAQGRFGPVFAERPTTIYMQTDRMAALVAYLHNNPVRAEKTRWACDSTWTSHRAWIGVEDPQQWLGVEKGLECAGFGSRGASVADFDQFVADRSGQPRDPKWSERWSARTRTRVRSATGLPLEVTSPVEFSPSEQCVGLLQISPQIVAPRWEGHLEELLVAVAASGGISVDMLRSRSHVPAAVAARRLVMVTGVLLLRRRTNELAGAMGIADPSASRLLRDAERLLPQARAVVNLLTRRQAAAEKC